MKIKFLTLCVCMILSIIGANAETFDKKNSVTYNVSMHCGSCKNRIETNLPKEKGVTDLKVDLANKLVTVEYSEKTNAANIKAALTKMGFTVTPYDGKATMNGAQKSCCKMKQAGAQKSCCKMKQAGAKKSCCKMKQAGAKKSCCKMKQAGAQKSCCKMKK